MKRTGILGAIGVCASIAFLASFSFASPGLSAEEARVAVPSGDLDVDKNSNPAGRIETRPEVRSIPLSEHSLQAERHLTATAVPLLREAAGYGEVPAQFELATAYLKGTHVDRDSAWAALWFGRAAYRGHVESQFMYGRLKMLGLGLPKDSGQAYRWLKIASRGGHAEARDLADELEFRLSIDLLYLERRRAETFEPYVGFTLADTPAIEFVQNKLDDLGYEPGSSDGVWGPQTAAALEIYQVDEGLSATGRISEGLLDHMRIKPHAVREGPPEADPGSGSATVPAPSASISAPSTVDPPSERQKNDQAANSRWSGTADLHSGVNCVQSFTVDVVLRGNSLIGTIATARRSAPLTGSVGADGAISMVSPLWAMTRLEGRVNGRHLTGEWETPQISHTREGCVGGFKLTRY